MGFSRASIWILPYFVGCGRDTFIDIRRDFVLDYEAAGGGKSIRITNFKQLFIDYSNRLRRVELRSQLRGIILSI